MHQKHLWLLLILIILVLLYSFRELHCLRKWRSTHQSLVDRYRSFECGTAENNLFIKYGGIQGIMGAVDVAVSNLIAEPTLANVFSVVGQPTHRSGLELKACLDLQFSSLLGFALPYPSRTFTRGISVNARNMRDSHRNIGLNITTAQFNTFVNILATSLVQAGISQADVNALAPTLTAMSSDIVGGPLN